MLCEVADALRRPWEALAQDKAGHTRHRSAKRRLIPAVRKWGRVQSHWTMATRRLVWLAALATSAHAFVATRARPRTPLFSSEDDDAAPDAPGIECSADDAGEVKARLFAACAACDRGFAASPADRAAVEALLDELSPLSPVAEPTRGLGVDDDAPLRKCWRLIYTSASDVSTLAANPLAALGGIYQDARELPLVVNVIDTFPRALANLPPAVGAGLATSTRLRVQTRARPRSATRVGLSFERVAVEQLALFGQAAPDWLPKPAVDLPQLGLDLQRRVFGVGEDTDPRDAESNPAFFDVEYLDEELLVIRQGSPGGVFAAVAVDELAGAL